MSDTSGAFGTTGSTDRLSSLRAAAAPAPTRSRTSSARAKVRLELWAGVILVLGGIALALYLRGGADTAPTTQIPSADSVPASPDSQPVQGLLAGEVVVAFPADDGHYPPSLGAGDEVRLIVTPGMDGAGEVRPLPERTFVVSVDSPSASGGERVITVRGPESIATALAASGPVRVAIVKVG